MSQEVDCKKLSTWNLMLSGWLKLILVHLRTPKLGVPSASKLRRAVTPALVLAMIIGKAKQGCSLAAVGFALHA